jgi:hypothetical protein
VGWRGESPMPGDEYGKININRILKNGVETVEFQTVTVSINDSVFWHNNDSKAGHWPVFQGQVMIGKALPPAPTSNSDWWPIPASPASPITYQCQQHAGETGQIVVVANFLLNAALATPTVGTLYTQSLSTGGMPTYVLNQINGQVPPGLTVAATATGIGISGTPTQAGSFSFWVDAQDGLGSNLQKTITLTVNPAT